MNRRGFVTGITASALGGRSAFAKHSERNSITAVDTHAHIFERSLQLAAGRRYTPDYDAKLDEYLRLLDENGISHGVLVQPSFLGTDNTYLSTALKTCPTRLRGIAVVDPSASNEELSALSSAGVVGIRLNMVGAAAPDLNGSAWQAFLARIARFRWLVEVQKEAHDLPLMLPPLLESGVNIVVDHFGRPDPKLGIDDPGFRFLLSCADTRRVWVKLSGAYRNGDGGRGDEIATQAVPLLRTAFGTHRLLWGSDWPHTQFEKTTTFAATRRLLDSWITDAAGRHQILVDTPRELFHF